MALGKKTLFVMVPANLLLWGYISYAVYQYMHEPEFTFPNEVIASSLKLNEDTTTYVLNLDYPDPFLKEEVIKKPKQHNSNFATTKIAVKPQLKNTKATSAEPAKDIKYLGLIQNKTSGTITALVSINGKSYIIKKGEIIEGVNFESITDQIIIAKIGREKLTINKS